MKVSITFIMFYNHYNNFNVTTHLPCNIHKILATD